MKALYVLAASLILATPPLANAQYGFSGGTLETTFTIVDGSLIVNGGFEQTHLINPFQIDLPGATTINGWTIDGAGVVHTGSYWQASEGLQSVELNYLASGGIAQTLITDPGQAYQLEFDLSGEPGNGDAIKDLQVFWDNSLFITMSFDTTGYTTDNMGWQHVTLRLPAATSGSTQLRFFGSSPEIGNGGAAIDNVSMIAVPETSSMLLAALVVIPAGLFVRRTRKQTV